METKMQMLTFAQLVRSARQNPVRFGVYTIEIVKDHAIQTRHMRALVS